MITTPSHQSPPRSSKGSVSSMSPPPPLQSSLLRDHAGFAETNCTGLFLTCMVGSSGSVWPLRAPRRCLWSACCLVSAPPPGEKTHAALHHFRYLIQQCVFCRHHTCSLVQETSMWTEQGITRCGEMMVCVCVSVCVVFCNPNEWERRTCELVKVLNILGFLGCFFFFATSSD